MYYYICSFAGIPMNLAFHFEETASYYDNAPDFYGCCSEPPFLNYIEVPAEEIHKWKDVWNIPVAAYVEYILSCSYICDALMKKHRFVLHGASFLWNNHAYIFTAASGTGKTTQLNLWKTLLGDDVTILNGDKPIIEINQYNQVIAHPSPWKGKEGFGRDDIKAPLSGLIVLTQDKVNTIEKMDLGEAAKVIFGRIYSTFCTEEEVLNAAQLLEQLLSYVPVWRLNNKGDLESAKITYQTLLREAL